MQQTTRRLKTCRENEEELLFCLYLLQQAGDNEQVTRRRKAMQCFPFSSAADVQGELKQ
jgi:hypothetical protein